MGEYNFSIPQVAYVIYVDGKITWSLNFHRKIVTWVGKVTGVGTNSEKGGYK